MITYGNITYSTANAQQPITSGICEGFTYKDSEQIYEVQGEGAAIAAIVPHGKKGDLSFSSTPLGGVTALGVRAGSALTISTIAGGKIIVTTSSAKWQRGQAMVMDAAATHYPSLTGDGTGTLTTGSFALDNGTGALVLPTDAIWWSTTGITAAVAGIVQACGITETVQIAEEEDAKGDIVAIAVHSYKATATMEILTAGAAPAPGSTLALFGSFRVTSAEEKWAKGNMRSISIEGVCYPGVTS